MENIIGIDLDDTITEMPEFFSALTAVLYYKPNVKIHIITYRDQEDRADTIKELTKYGIHYHELHLPRQQDECAEEWKSELATKLGIQLMIDDSPEVLAEMPKGTKRMWLADSEVFNLRTCVHAMKKSTQSRKLPIIK